MNVNESSKYLLKQEIFLGKVLVIRKIVVPLHPLSLKNMSVGTEKRVL